MFSIGAALSIRKATELRGCMTHAARAWPSRTETPAPPGAVAPSGMRPGLSIPVSSQVAHGLSETARQRGGTGPGREDRKPLLECASQIVPYISFRGAKESRRTTVVKQAAPMLAYILAQLPQDMRVRAHLEALVSERIAITT